MKVGTVADIPLLKQRRLLGLDLEMLKRVPSGLPAREDYFYFAIEKDGPYWANVVRRPRRGDRRRARSEAEVRALHRHQAAGARPVDSAQHDRALPRRVEALSLPDVLPAQGAQGPAASSLEAVPPLDEIFAEQAREVRRTRGSRRSTTR